MINRLIDKCEINYQEYLKINRQLSFKVLSSNEIYIDYIKSAKNLVTMLPVSLDYFLHPSTHTSIVTLERCLSKDFQLQLRCLFLSSLFLKHNLDYDYKVVYDLTYNNIEVKDPLLITFSKMNTFELFENFFNLS